MPIRVENTMAVEDVRGCNEALVKIFKAHFLTFGKKSGRHVVGEESQKV